MRLPKGKGIHFLSDVLYAAANRSVKSTEYLQRRMAIKSLTGSSNIIDLNRLTHRVSWKAFEELEGKLTFYQQVNGTRLSPDFIQDSLKMTVISL